jgi:hypothetical protein
MANATWAGIRYCGRKVTLLRVVRFLGISLVFIVIKVMFRVFFGFTANIAFFIIFILIINVNVVIVGKRQIIIF